MNKIAEQSPVEPITKKKLSDKFQGIVERKAIIIQAEMLLSFHKVKT